MEVFKIGFTGSRQGMTLEQREVFRVILTHIYSSPTLKSSHLIEVHVGDCIGSDVQAAEIAKDYGFKIIGHPPTDDKKRAFLDYDLELRPKPYLVRDRDIATICQYLIATPKEFEEVLHSGTWSTIRYAVSLRKPVYVIYPDGSVEYDIQSKLGKNTKAEQKAP